MSARILYVVDPMCSWCYGLAPALDQVRSQLRENVAMDLVMGGLAPDSDEPMDETTRGYVQHAWQAVEAQTGVPFNHEFWTQCAPRRSTYPACRAIVLARESGLQWEMLKAIQSAYYLEARNPSDAATLVELAVGLGMDQGPFVAGLEAAETQQKLAADFALRRSLDANSFPSIGIVDEHGKRLLCSGYLSEHELTSVFANAGLLR
ncbi:MAG: putative protein-disulfide isomerase [Planctomycetota bacterium]|jgi:putative protein-disulfide isomerase